MNNTEVTIEIADGKIDTKTGKIKSGQRAGEEYRIRTQEGYMDTGDHYPVKISISLADDNAGYPPGHYTLDKSSYSVGEFGVPTMKRQLVLRPVAKPAVKAA